MVSNPSNDSDSSIKTTKNKKPKTKNQMVKQSLFDLSSSNSSSSSDENPASIITVKKRRKKYVFI